MGIIDKGLNFGLQNFVFCTQDTTGGVYDYVAYQSRKGSTLIGRYKKDETEALYYISGSAFATVWAARTTVTYKLPHLLEDPTV